MGDSIMPFWDDLTTDNYTAKSIYYTTIGTAGSRKFIVQWTNMSFCCSAGVPMGTFQAILYEGSNKIQFQYRNLSDGTRPQGDSATIGINHEGITAQTYSYETASLNAGDAISYTPDGFGDYTTSGTLSTYDPLFLYIDGLPATPELIAPADSSSNVSLTPSFEWSAANLATSYRIVIATDNAFSNIVYNDTNVTGTTYNLSNATLNPSTTYYWRVVSANDAGFGYSNANSFTTTATPNTPPNTPINVAPDSLLTGQTVNIATLHDTPHTMSLSDPDVGNQVGYEVQYSTDSGFSNLVIDHRSAVSNQGDFSYTFGENSGTYLVGDSSTALVGGQEYYFRVRTVDDQGATSDWFSSDGPAFVFDSTAPDDGDGSGSTIENSGPNNGDANNDGIPDNQQATVTSVLNPVNNKYAVLQTSGECTLNNEVSVSDASTNNVKDKSFVYPAGMMHYKITCPSPGMTATVTQFYYGVDPTNLVLRKYNSNTKTYADITGATISSVTIGGQQAAKIVYQITDGSALDEDGSANGTIEDPSGLAFAVKTNSSAPSTRYGMSNNSTFLGMTLWYGLISFVVVVMGLGLKRFRSIK